MVGASPQWLKKQELDSWGTSELYDRINLIPFFSSCLYTWIVIRNGKFIIPSHTGLRLPFSLCPQLQFSILFMQSSGTVYAACVALIWEIMAASWQSLRQILCSACSLAVRSQLKEANNNLLANVLRSMCFC